MATSTPTPAPQAQGNPALQDGVRQRELYRYFTPPTLSPGTTATASRFSTPDSVLTSQVQLAAWRLNCRRAMLSLIDRDTQYFIAESTKTLDLAGSGTAEVEGDELWLDLGCSAVPKAGRLCEYTISQLASTEGGPAYFEVTDLLADARFRDLPFVCGGPGLRYYCGVPLRTRTGVNIGSIFVLDVKPREPASALHREVLGALADNCMLHLDMLREKQANEKAMNMNKCLAAFVDPKRRIAKRSERCLRNSSPPAYRTPSRESPKAELSNRPKLPPEQMIQPRSETDRSRSRGSDRRPRSSEDSSASGSDTSKSRSHVTDDECLNTYQRAAELLKKSLSLEGGGGVLFLAPSQATRLDPTEESSSVSVEEQSSNNIRANSGEHATARLNRSWGVRVEWKTMSAGTTPLEPANVLASSLSTSDGSDSGASEHAATFDAVATRDIVKLLKRYPRGKLFSSVGDNLYGSSSSGEEKHGSAPNSNHHIPRSKRVEGSSGARAFLLKHFPAARQVIFLPLWDSSTSRWCACFAFNTCEYRYLDKAPDFLHCVAFGNCIMSETSRIAMMTSDRQKSDFIGSISHELRSPLHGILASCEFLADTECDSFQKSLVDTTDACARTLLDTLNMVLDYSRINHFERKQGQARKSRKDASTALIAGQTQGITPLLNIYGNVDLAVVTEEVVEGAASGHIFKDSLNTVSIPDLLDPLPSQVRRPGPAPTAPADQVQVILDIAARDWTFVTQPGAFRRIIMNLVGNALKYTRRGFIRVKLETEDAVQAPHSEASKPTSAPASVVLTIADSGSGMSAEFMHTKLFTPFSQESMLNEGTGLGLSLVRSLVKLLNGEISLQSAPNVGTEVRVILPMLKGDPFASSASSPPSSSGSTIERAKDENLAIVQNLSKGRSISLFQQEANGQSLDEKRGAHMLVSLTSHYLRDWFKFPTKEWSPHDPADIVVVAECDLQGLIEKDESLSSGKSRTIVLVLCQIASRQAIKNMVEGIDVVKTLSCPFGPYKLAKSLRVCLEHLHRLTPPTAAEQPKSCDADQCLNTTTDISEAVQHVTLGSEVTESPSFAVIQQGDTLGSEASVGAQMALDTVRPCSRSDDIGMSDGEFPFPNSNPTTDGTVSPQLAAVPTSSLRPPLEERRTLSTTQPEISHFENAYTSTATSSAGAAITNNPLKPLDETAKLTRPPRLLLVDDNPINLRLLNSFMRRREHTSLTLAENGSQAVAAFTSMMGYDPPVPPDIVFMDLTMPVMDGFQATRRIRQVEAEVQDKLTPVERPARALIIALTGLASGRDQSEAFSSGFDLYLTKPVSMKEVGRLLTNWEQNGGAASQGVPHGPVVSAPKVHV